MGGAPSARWAHEPEPVGRRVRVGGAESADARGAARAFSCARPRPAAPARPKGARVAGRAPRDGARVEEARAGCIGARESEREREECASLARSTSASLSSFSFSARTPHRAAAAAPALLRTRALSQDTHKKAIARRGQSCPLVHFCPSSFSLLPRNPQAPPTLPLPPPRTKTRSFSQGTQSRLKKRGRPGARASFF